MGLDIAHSALKPAYCRLQEGQKNDTQPGGSLWVEEEAAALCSHFAHRNNSRPPPANCTPPLTAMGAAEGVGRWEWCVTMSGKVPKFDVCHTLHKTTRWETPGRLPRQSFSSTQNRGWTGTRRRAQRRPVTPTSNGFRVTAVTTTQPGNPGKHQQPTFHPGVHTKQATIDMPPGLCSVDLDCTGLPVYS